MICSLQSHKVSVKTPGTHCRLASGVGHSMMTDESASSSTPIYWAVGAEHIYKHDLLSVDFVDLLDRWMLKKPQRKSS